MAKRPEISFASFNLYNLQLPGKAMYRNKDGWTEEAYQKKINWTAQTIKHLDAKVWGFQELWHVDALKEAFEKAGLLNEYDLLVPPNHSGKSIICGAAVKKGILYGSAPIWIRDFPPKFKLASGGDDPQTPKISVSIKKFSRPVLRFRIKPTDKSNPITVFVAHLKSKRPTALYPESWYKKDKEFYKRHDAALGYTISTIRRSAEAAALRMFLTEDLKGTSKPVVVLGDLNDGQLSNTLNILTGQPSYLLSGLRRGGSDTGLYASGTLQEYRSLRDVYYTHIHENIRESLDHILVSQEFYDNSRKRVWAFKGMEIINDHINRDDHKESGTSDHGIVKATFELNPAKK